jgi:hypothetical protein
MGDFNAQLVQSDAYPFSPNTKSNRNTDLLVELMEENDLKAVNTLFRKNSSSQLVSFYGMKDRKVTLDYILMRSKWIKSARNCVVKSPLSIASDHNLVALSIKWRLQNHKKVQPLPRYDYSLMDSSKVAADIDSHYKFDQSIGIANYSTLASSIREAVKRNVPNIVRVKKSEPWMDSDVCEVRERYHSARLVFKSRRTNENRQVMANLAKELSDLYVLKQQRYLNNIASDIMNLTGDHRSKAAWRQINFLSGRKCRMSGLIAAEDANERLKLWFNHFSNLLSPSSETTRQHLNLDKVFSNLSFTTGAISKNELEFCAQSLKTDKAYGVDEIANDILKCPAIFDHILEFFNYCYQSKLVPSEWTKSLIVPVFKKGDPNVCGNYRGIALMSACAKLYNKILLYRLTRTIDPILRYNQNGFRSLRSTGQHVFTLRRIYEEIQATKNGRVATVFIDYCKAFDSVDWNYIENILLAYDVPDEIVKAIMSIYYGAQAAVKTDTQVSEYFDLGVGVLQGDSLAPYLFDIVVDWIFRNAIPPDDTKLGLKLANAKGSRSRPISPTKFLTDLDYADDIALVSSSDTNIQQLFLNVEKWSLKVGLRINVDKTVFLLIGNWENKQVIIKTNSGLALKQVTDFKYLGSWLVSSLKDFNVRKALAWDAIKGLNRLWKSSVLDQLTKFRLFQSLIGSIYFYNASTWTMNTTLTKKFDGGYNRLLRYALNIRWDDKVKNCTIFTDLEIPKASTQLLAMRLTFIGHCWRSRHTAQQPVSDALFWTCDCDLGRKKGRRSNFIKLLMNETGRSVEELKRDMDNRVVWRDLVTHLKNSLPSY